MQSIGEKMHNSQTDCRMHATRLYPGVLDNGVSDEVVNAGIKAFHLASNMFEIPRLFLSCLIQDRATSFSLLAAGDITQCK